MKERGSEKDLFCLGEKRENCISGEKFITFISLSVDAKNKMEKELKTYSFISLGSETGKYEPKRKFMKRNKAKNGILISLLLEATILMRKKGKEAKKYFFSHFYKQNAHFALFSFL
jgi:hypothetical protein